MSKNLLLPVLLGLSLSTLSLGAWSESYPSHPIKLIVPHAAGSSPDAVARVITPKLSERLGQPIVIDNRVGAGGAIGLGAAAKAPADGYTLVVGHVGTLTINPNIYTNLPYDSKKDFAPISMSVTTPLLMVVSAESPFKTVSDVIAYAKKNPEKITFSSAGNGTASHMAGVLFGAMAGITITHIPYKAAPAALTSVIAGDVTFTFGGQPPAWPLVKGNKLRALGLSSLTRVSDFPETPAVAESVSGFEVLDWNGLMAPTGTPIEVIERLNTEIKEVFKDPEIVKKLRSQGLLPATGSPAQFIDRIESETLKWAKVSKDIKLQLD
jgi:tripartite-type tricarboxylate transporter receptor subunit TctC